MLILNRKLNESIQIGPDVTVTVMSINRDKVRIGVQAPDDLRIRRVEEWPKKRLDTPE